MEQFSYPNSQFVTITGGPSAGWKMHVYNTGTTDYADIFSDAAQTMPTDNPITADAEGFFASFFWTGTVDVIVADENDVEQNSALEITDLATEVLTIIASGSASIPSGTATGTGDAISLTLPISGDFSNLSIFLMKANATNTGAANTPNLQVNALPNRRIKKGSGVALVTGDIAPSLNCLMVYNESDDSYYILNPDATSLWRDGSKAMLGILDMGAFKIVNAADGEALTDAPNIKQVQSSAFNLADMSISLSGVTTSTSIYVTGIDTSKLSAGLNVSGTGIPALTTIVSVDSATQITLSAAATVTGSPSLTFTGSPDGIAIFVSPVPSENNGVYYFIASETNAGPATITVSGLPPADITKYGISPLSAGDIVSGRAYQVTWDGVRYQLANPATAVNLPKGFMTEWPVPIAPAWSFARNGAAKSQALFPDLFEILVPEQDAVTVSASATVSGIASTIGFYIGMPVQGDGIPSSTTVSQIPSSTSVVLSNAATATNASAKIRFFYYGFGSGGTDTDFGLPNHIGRSPRSYDPSGSVEQSALNCTTASNTSITGISSTVGLFVGMSITGSGIPASTTITQINGATSITISNAATNSTTAQRIVYGRVVGVNTDDTFQGHGFGTIRSGLSGAAGSDVFVLDNSAGNATITITNPITDGINGTPRFGPETKSKSYGTLPIIVY